MKNESQHALLLLRQYLYQQTDEQHPVSVTDILAFWQQHGIQAGRKSVYTDIELLQNAGMDIVCVKSSQNKYFVGQRLFELPELKLLVDAVESSRFITEKKSTALIKKLGHLTSTAQAEQLNRRIYMGGTPKPENESIYYNVDTIHNAVQKKQQITFQYFEYTPKKEKVLKHDGYKYRFSPYAMIWNRDCYQQMQAPFFRYSYRFICGSCPWLCSKRSARSGTVYSIFVLEVCRALSWPSSGSGPSSSR